MSSGFVFQFCCHGTIGNVTTISLFNQDGSPRTDDIDIRISIPKDPTNSDALGTLIGSFSPSHTHGFSALTGYFDPATGTYKRSGCITDNGERREGRDVAILNQIWFLDNGR